MPSASPARERFASRLVEEVALAAPAWRDPQPFDTVYFGGGTPSQLSPEELARVLDACRTHLAFATPAPWVFLEANPEDVTPEACAAWRALGVRTLSLGVQSFSDEALRFLGRRHSGRQARAAVETALAAGFDTVSIDLIFGLRGQTAEDWRRDLAAAVALGPQHLSCYQLTIHPRTRFGVQAKHGQLSELPEDDQATLFELTHRFLADAGWPAYEVSNFARGPAHQSRHNRKYWDHTPYLGLGPSAHSLAASTRRRRPAVGGTSAARRGGRDGWRRVSVRSRRRRSWVRRTWRRRRCCSACAPRPGSTSTASGRATVSTCWPRTTPSSRASWTRAAWSCAPTRRAAGGWCRRCPGWPWPTAWPRRSTSRCRTEIVTRCGAPGRSSYASGHRRRSTGPRHCETR